VFLPSEAAEKIVKNFNDLLFTNTRTLNIIAHTSAAKLALVFSATF
jgi:hypothetical protein